MRGDSDPFWRRAGVPAVVLWASVIFFATSIPGSQLPTVRTLPHLDKAVHFSLYAVLGWCVSRADWRISLPALAIGIILFGAVDEWHQQWIPGRGASVGDLAADALGGVVGLLSFRWAQRRPEYLDR